jgi:hypothetical protein
MDELPDELVLEILEYLYHTDVRHLWTISLANRRLHRIAKTLIYRTFSLDCGDPALFIRTLASTPSLKNYVQDVDWDCRRRNNYTLVTSDVFQFSEDFTPAECQSIEEKVGYRSSVGMKGLNQRFTFLGEEAYLSTFLLFTPKVKTISITIPTKWDHHAIWFKPVLNSQMFANLQKAHIIGPTCIQNVYALFLVPSLRTLTLDDVFIDRNLVQQGKNHEWRTNTEVLERLQREGSGLEHFNVQGAWITAAREVERLLKLFRHLQTLELEFENEGYPTDVNDLCNILMGATHQYDSLTSLSLRMDCTVQDLSVLELLKDAKHLRFLKVGIMEFDEQSISPKELRTFLGHLPSHLEELVLKITNIDGDDHMASVAFTDAMQAIAATTNTILPSLKKLTISGWDPLLGTFMCQTQLKALQLGFAKAGIELLSRPWTVTHMADNQTPNDPDLYALDYIVEDWLWVQWIWNGEWVLSRMKRIGSCSVRLIWCRSMTTPTMRWVRWSRMCLYQHIRDGMLNWKGRIVQK